MATAREMRRTHRAVLARVADRFGVDPAVLVSVWGLESNFGQFAGVRPTVSVLSTLGYESRRADFFRGELIDALRILSRGDITLAGMRGSWAGAMGQPQFMPISYLKYAVDFDADGRRDIWASDADVFASIANYLREHGWVPGERWGRQVRVSQSAASRVAAGVAQRASACRATRELLRVCRGPGGRRLLADAELALVGRVAPGRRAPEGPFGDHYGYYSLRHDYPVFEVEWLARRRDAIFPATVVGKPRQEDFFLGDLLQELLAPLFPLVMPGVLDLWSYGETGYHSLAAAVVCERYAREAMASAFRILGEGQLALTKFLLLTDRRLDLRDFRAVPEHVLARTRAETDLFVFAESARTVQDAPF